MIRQICVLRLRLSVYRFEKQFQLSTFLTLKASGKPGLTSDSVRSYYKYSVSKCRRSLIYILLVLINRIVQKYILRFC